MPRKTPAEFTGLLDVPAGYVLHFNQKKENMTYKHFWLSCLIVVAVCLIFGTVGFFVNRQAIINRETELAKTKVERDASVQQAEINATLSIERAKIEQAAETARTKERWEWTQRIPGLKGDAQKAD